MPRACRRSRISLAPLGLRRRRPRLAAAWAGGLLANAMRVRLVLPRQNGGAGVQIKYLKRAVVRYAAINTEK